MWSLPYGISSLILNGWRIWAFCGSSLDIFIAVRSRTGKIHQVYFSIAAFREINMRAICFQCCLCLCSYVVKGITGPLHFISQTFQTEQNLCGQQSHWQADSVCELISSSCLLRQHLFLSNNVAGNVCMSA